MSRRRLRLEAIWSSLLSRALVWGTIFGVLYLLRSFSLLIFLVFIFSYIQANAVDKLESTIPARTPRVLLVGVSFLALFVLAALVLVPQIRDQAVHLLDNSSKYAHSIDKQLITWLEKYPALEEMLPEPKPSEQTPQAPPETETAAQVETEQGEWKFRHSRLAGVLQSVFGAEEGVDKESVVSVFQTLRDFGSKLVALVSQFFLSLLFSFLIVYDLPRLVKGAKSLRNTKLRYVYDEVSENLVSFGLTMGRAFEAQFIVALVNTVLTAVGIWFINIRDELAFISLIVFICGFIPIAGVFISSIPICLLALADGGPTKVIGVIVLITAVHAIESYIVNPKIFGTHMKLNPVMVMILMTVSGKLFGVWGLVLCLPVTTYIFQDAIQLKNKALGHEPEAQKLGEGGSEGPEVVTFGGPPLDPDSEAEPPGA